MKLRIQGNSLRLRLSEAELQQFGQTGRVAEDVVFGPQPNQTFHYLLMRSPDHAVVSATFLANTVAVYVPIAVADHWINSEHNALEGHLDNGLEEGLKILIEKDLDCRH